MRKKIIYLDLGIGIFQALFGHALPFSTLIRSFQDHPITWSPRPAIKNWSFEIKLEIWHVLLALKIILFLGALESPSSKHSTAWFERELNLQKFTRLAKKISRLETNWGKPFSWLKSQNTLNQKSKNKISAYDSYCFVNYGWSLV